MQSQPIPTQLPDQFAGVSGLGSPQGVYPVAASNRWVSAIGGAVMLLLSLLAVVYALIDAYVQVSRYGSAVFIRTVTAPFIIAAFLFLFGILAAVNAYQNWKKALVIYENGLAYSDNAGVQTWMWTEVEWLSAAITKHYTNGIYTGTTYVYNLRKADGAKLTLDNKFKQIEAIGRLINQKVAPIQYSRLRQQLNNGQSVVLGPVTISLEGMAINKKSYPWSAIEQVGINKGYVSIKQKGGGWFSGATAAASAIPNLDALLAVVEQLVKLKAG